MNMKKTYSIFLGSVTVLFLLMSCDDNKFGDPTPVSVPIITSATIVPTSFTYGDSVMLTAIVSDPETPLSELAVSLIVENKIVPVTTLNLRTGETSVNVSAKIFIPLVDNIPDNAPVSFALKLTNTRNSAVTRELTGFTGNRPYFSQLYLVTDEGGVYPLTPQIGNRDNYEIANVVLNRVFNYKIAQKITADNQIDYSGLVWGDVKGKIQLVNETGNSIFAFAGNDITTAFVFNNYRFVASLAGSAYNVPNLMLENFEGPVTINNEKFYKTSITLEQNQELAVYNELSSMKVVFNVDFFDRIEANKVKFLGEAGDYTLYYNPVRKHVIVETPDPGTAGYKVGCGYGMGYPTKITRDELRAVYSTKNLVTTSWGFGHIQQYVLFRRIADNVYQATVYMPGDHDHYASIGIYDNKSYGNQQPAISYTITGENIFTITGNTFNIPNGFSAPQYPAIESDTYRMTINVLGKTMHVERYTLP
jgi:hypothetical protein